MATVTDVKGKDGPFYFPVQAADLWKLTDFEDL